LNSTVGEIWRRHNEIVDSLTVGAAAAKVGLTAHTLRWYEQVGLVDPVARDTAGRRRYGVDDLNRLEFLTRLRTTGMPVREMLRYVELARLGPSTTAERRAILVAHRDRVLARMAGLQRDLDVIDVKIGMYG
jgi:DNA-binding transcriptional MerR regulator